MASGTKSRGKRGRSQAKKPRAIKNTPRKIDREAEIEAELLALNRRQRELEAAKKEIKRYKRALPIHKQIRSEAKTLRGQAKLLMERGLYSPKKKRKTSARSKRGKKDTTAAYIKKLWKEHGPEFGPEYLFVRPKTKSKATRDRILKKAKEAGLETTKTGILVKREGDMRGAKIVRDPDVGFRVEATRKFHHSKMGRSEEKIIRPLASADELDAKREKLRQSFKRLAGKTRGKKNQRIRVYVEGKYGTHRTFKGDDFNALWSLLLEYRNTHAERFGFIQQIKLGIAKPGDPRNRVKTYKVLEYEKRQRRRSRK